MTLLPLGASPVADATADATGDAGRCRGGCGGDRGGCNGIRRSGGGQSEGAQAGDHDVWDERRGCHAPVGALGAHQVRPDTQRFRGRPASRLGL